MNDFTFELQPFENVAQHGLAGTVGPYGEVKVFYVKPVQPAHSRQVLRTHLVAERLPETYVTSGLGMGGQPSLSRASLEVDGVAGTLKYNPFGIRRASRALHIRYADRTYTYTSTGFSRTVELSRDGAQVALKNGEIIRGVGSVRLGSTHGAVDEVDLAIALVLEEVETDSLTLGTAIASAPFKLLSTPDSGGAG